jgi:hypothetical protein
LDGTGQQSLVFGNADVGMRLEPTGRTPRHYTLGFDDQQDGVERLVRCTHQVMSNAYYDA